MSEPKTSIAVNPWHVLRQFTDARIALGRAGVSQPTGPQLEFQLAHARARDAVHHAVDAQKLAQDFVAGLPQGPLPALLLHSGAENRGMYLQRPDLGRKLDAPSRAAVQALSGPGQTDHPARPWDLAFVIADGLSARAVEQNALPFMQALMPRLASTEPWCIAPLAIVGQGRVAVGDEVGQLLGVQAVVVLIGERPGLSSPDSMGIYLTWQPRIGMIDAGRNCISNVRPAGMAYDEAAHKLHYLLLEARRRRVSGVALKDEAGASDVLADVNAPQFLL